MTISVDAHPAQIISCANLWASEQIPFLPYGQGIHDLSIYLDLLLKWNRKLNLSGCQDIASCLQNLVQDSFFLASFLDALALQKNWPSDSMQIWDLGAGAGIPGIPLRIFWSSGAYTWIERRQKRALFLENVCARLQLPNCTGFPGDAIEFFASTAKKAECILSRAFMPWEKLLNFCASQLKPSGSVVIMANQAPPELPTGWKLDSSISYSIPEKSHWIWAVSRL